jgi:hypothetical protein
MDFRQQEEPLVSYEKMNEYKEREFRQYLVEKDMALAIVKCNLIVSLPCSSFALNTQCQRETRFSVSSPIGLLRHLQRRQLEGLRSTLGAGRHNQRRLTLCLGCFTSKQKIKPCRPRPQNCQHRSKQLSKRRRGVSRKRNSGNRRLLPRRTARNNRKSDSTHHTPLYNRSWRRSLSISKKI